MKKDDEEKNLRKNFNALNKVMKDAVKISRMLSKYDESSEFMSILGATFSTWCDAHELALSERKALLKRMMELLNEC